MNGGAGRLVTPVMFLSSYAPLFALLVVRFETPLLRGLCAGLAVAGFGGTWLLLRRQTAVNPVEYRLTSVKPAGAEASAYLAGYLLPFITVAEPGASDLVAYVIFLIVAYAIHAKTGIIQVNPSLFLLGWKILAVEERDGFSGYLLTKQRVRAPATLRCTRIGDDVIVDLGAFDS